MPMDQSKTVQARITKSSTSAAWKTLVSGFVKFFYKLKGVILSEGTKWEGVGKICDFKLIQPSKTSRAVWDSLASVNK